MVVLKMHDITSGADDANSKEAGDWAENAHEKQVKSKKCTKIHCTKRD